MASDGFKINDGFSIGLQCGHPATEPGKQCQNCGTVLPVAEEQKTVEKADDAQQTSESEG